MFIDIILLLLVGLAGIGFMITGLMTRKGLFFLIGSLMLLILPIFFEGYSVDTWVAGGEGTENVSPYDVQSSTGQVLVNAVSGHSRGERVSNSASALVGEQIDCITVFLGRSGAPPNTTLIRVGVMDSAGVMVQEFGSMNVTGLITAAVQPYDFCLPIGQAYEYDTGVQVAGVKYNAGDASNTVTMRIDGNDPFDSSNTEHVHMTASSWVQNAGQDVYMIQTLRGLEGADATLNTVEYPVMEQWRALFGVGIGVVLFVVLKRLGLG